MDAPPKHSFAPLENRLAPRVQDHPLSDTALTHTP